MKNRSLKKTLYTALILNVILTLAIFAIVILNLLSKGSNGIEDNVTFILILLCAAFIINIYILIRSIRINLMLVGRYSSLEKSISEVEELNNSLRVQRHDFLNHLQIVHGLIELREFREAGKYIKEIHADIQSVSKFLKTSQPAINALIQAKTLSAEKKGIKVELDIKSKMNLLPMHPWEICRIISNLIDNAIDSLMEHSENKKIQIGIFEKISSYSIVVADNGPKIPKEASERMFEPGFSTKSKEDKGMGLTIVNDIIESFKGSISFTSDDRLTKFIVTIPKKI